MTPHLIDQQRLRELPEGTEGALAVLSHAPAPMALLDASEKFIATNAAFERVLGWHPDELAGLPASSVVHPTDDGWMVDTVDGLGFPADVDVWPLGIDGLLAVLVRPGEVVPLPQALVGPGSVVSDVEDGHLLSMSQRARRLFGYAESDVAHLRMADLHPGGTWPPPELGRSLHDVVEGDGTWHGTLRARRSSGAVFLARTSLHAVLEHDGRRRLVSFHDDVTATWSQELIDDLRRDMAAAVMASRGVRATAARTSSVLCRALRRPVGALVLHDERLPAVEVHWFEELLGPLGWVRDDADLGATARSLATEAIGRRGVIRRGPDASRPTGPDGSEVAEILVVPLTAAGRAIGALVTFAPVEWPLPPSLTAGLLEIGGLAGAALLREYGLDHRRPLAEQAGFLQELAHDLRGPASVVTLAAATIESNSSQMSESQFRILSGSLQGAAERLRDVARRLHDLPEVREQQVGELVPVALADAVDAGITALDLPPGVTVRIEGVPATVPAVRGAVERLVGELVRAAGSRPAANVTVQYGVRGDDAWVTVTGDVPAPGDARRNAATDVVGALAEALGGSASWSKVEGGGTQATVTWPVAS